MFSELIENVLLDLITSYLYIGGDFEFLFLFFFRSLAMTAVVPH